MHGHIAKSVLDDPDKRNYGGALTVDRGAVARCAASLRPAAGSIR